VETGLPGERVLTDTWNPDQYRRFEKERDAPFWDLAARLPHLAGKRAVDLGCGTGRLTAGLHAKLGLASTLGLDNSPAMLAETKAFEGNGVTFREDDLQSFQADHEYDLVFSNAAIQWIDDHPSVLTRLKHALAPRGWLAIQMPANHGHLSHRLAAEVAAENPFREALSGYHRVSPVLEADRYVERLASLGFEDPIVSTRCYLHRLQSREEVVEWVKGTLLTDYQKRMPAPLWPKFLERYRERLLPELRDERPYLYPFNRIFLWAQA